MTNNMGDAIAASEVIVTREGAIYHLNLRPDQLANTVITVGDPGRVDAVSRHFDRIEHKVSHREFVTHTGYIGNKRLSVVSTGIGPDNIDIVLNELDALVNIDLTTRTIKEHHSSLSIIRLGTCGGLQPDVPTDTLVASAYGIGLDNLLHYYPLHNDEDEINLLNEFKTQTPFAAKGLHPYISRCSTKLQEAFAGLIQGITVTCPGFYAPQGRSLRLQAVFGALPDTLAAFRHGAHRVTNFEMETAALYGLGKLLHHDCLSISTVVANRSNGTFSTDVNTSVDNMITKALEVISAS